MMPARAFEIFDWPFATVVAIEPVRSSTIITSIGFAPQGWQAVAFAERSTESMPKMRENVRSTWAVARTWSAFTGLQPGAVARHDVVVFSDRSFKPCGQLSITYWCVMEAAA